MKIYRSRQRKKNTKNNTNIFPKVKFALLVGKAFKNMDFSKLKSRKFWITIATGIVVLILNGIGVDPDITTKITALVGTYVLGQGIADAGANGGSQGAS